MTSVVWLLWCAGCRGPWGLFAAAVGCAASAGPVPEWVFLVPPAGLSCSKCLKAPRSATPAALHRPLPISASSDSPTAYWPDTGVRHGPYAQHGQRTGPQGTPRCHRVLGKAHWTSQTPKGPLFRPRCSPDGRNMKIHTFRSNRAPRTHFSSRSTHQRHPSPDPGAPGPSWMLTKPI